MSNSKIATKPDEISDMYLYDMPVMLRQKVCKNLTNLQVWSVLARLMGYSTSQIDEIKNSTLHNTEAEELLIRWGSYNHTVTELFVLLRRFHQYKTMSIMKHLVDRRYHKLIPKTFISLDDLSGTMKDVHCDHPKKHKETNRDALDANESASSKREPRYNHLIEAVLELQKPTMPTKEQCDDEYTARITKVKYKEIRDATDNWNKENIVGKGGYGTVYKAIWKYTSVAVKRIILLSEENEQSLGEMKHLNAFRHENILQLYGCSINRGEICLVYQFMTGRSLQQRLFNRPECLSALTWYERRKIAIGTARGLQFLHTLKSGRPLIHGDIKPANILLDRYCDPKIGDFGLAREGNFEDEGIKVSKICGTEAYLPNEFKNHHILSVKVDSYSFGIVLLQLGTGLPAKEGSIYLRDHIQKLTEQCTLIDDIIDKSPDNCPEAEQIFKTLIYIGKKCTKEQLAIRLNMVKAFEILRNTFILRLKYV